MASEFDTSEKMIKNSQKKFKLEKVRPIFPFGIYTAPSSKRKGEYKILKGEVVDINLDKNKEQMEGYPYELPERHIFLPKTDDVLVKFREITNNGNTKEAFYSYMNYNKGTNEWKGVKTYKIIKYIDQKKNASEDKKRLMEI